MDNPSICGCGGRKCLTGFLQLLRPMRKKVTLTKPSFLHFKRNSKRSEKIENQTFLLRSLSSGHLATSSKDYYPVGPALKSSSGSGRQRHFYDEVQLALLDAEFIRDSFPNRESRRRIAQLIGVSEKSIMWWFQNRRRRARQIGSRAATSTLESNRQHRRSSPYAPRQRQHCDSYGSPQGLQTPGFCSGPVVPAQEEQPINYSTSESSTLSPLQSDWVASSCPQEIDYHNLKYSTNEQPQQQDYSRYWNNWQYSPPFYPSSFVTNQNVYPNSVSDPYDYSSSNSYYSPESNQYYCQSYM